MGTLNVKAIDALRVESGEKFIADGDGLSLRVRADGSKVWFYRYSTGGKTFKIQLGIYLPMGLGMGLSDARSIAATKTGERRQGIDPVTKKKEDEEKKKQAEQALAALITVGELFERWALVDLVRHKDGGAYVRDQITRHVLPVIGNLQAESVGKGHITKVSDKLLAEGKDRTAKVAFSLMRQMFRFALSRGIVTQDPTAAISKAAIGPKDVERDRVLSDNEIKDLHKQIASAKLQPTTEAAVWIALSTGCRIGELLKSQWGNLDFEKRTWIIPKEDAKNGKALTVTLSDFALAQFQRVKDAAEEEASKARLKDKGATIGLWAYPNRTGTDHVCPKTVTKQLSDRQREQAPMNGRSKAKATLKLSGGLWTPHDLRRTAATMMVQLGVMPEVVERCLNHSEQNKVKRIYQRHSYEPEMKQAWQLLGERLELLLRDDTDNVVLLRPAAA